MAFIRISDSTRKMLPNKIAKKASTEMTVGDVVITDSGQVTVAAGSSVLLLGICAKTIASTDSDYASTTAVEVEQIDPTAVYEADVEVGSATVANIGTQYDLNSADGITLSGTTYKQVKVVGVISASKVLVTFNPNLL